MNFFKSVFADDPEPSDEQHHERPDSDSPSKNSSEIEQQQQQQQEQPDHQTSSGSAWSFGGFIKTLSTKSESVLQTCRQDLEEFRSGLKKETALIREVTSRALKDLPSSLDAGASVAVESLESVGHAIDDIGSTVWRGTAEIISHGKEALLSADHESDSSDSQVYDGSSSGLISKRYSRFELQVRAIQSDLSTYCEDPEDLEEFDKWKSGFELREKGEEIENLVGENGVLEGVYAKLVPTNVDHETFWIRYFYRIHKLKLVEDARANLVKRAIAGDEEEELSWDVDEEEEEVSNVSLKKVGSELERIKTEGSQGGSSSEVVAEVGGKSSARDFEKEGTVAESISGNVADEKVETDAKSDHSVTNSDDSPKKFVEGKIEAVEYGKDSDFSVVSSQPSLPEEDLSWDEIEDLSSIDERKGVVGGSPNKIDARKRLSAADEDEDLSWDV